MTKYQTTAKSKTAPKEQMVDEASFAAEGIDPTQVRVRFIFWQNGKRKEVRAYVHAVSFAHAATTAIREVVTKSREHANFIEGKLKPMEPVVKALK